MNKAFEKILERLEDWTFSADVVMPSGERMHKRNLIASYNAKQIVQEVAEEYNGGWIACSERLPEECTEVLVSVKEIDGSFYTRTSWVQDGVWVIKKTPLQPTVIAWQPLPEPFKERD